MNTSPRKRKSPICHWHPVAVHLILLRKAEKFAGSEGRTVACSKHMLTLAKLCRGSLGLSVQYALEQIRIACYHSKSKLILFAHILTWLATQGLTRAADMILQTVVHGQKSDGVQLCMNLRVSV
jgi:hypothetical protein